VKPRLGFLGLGWIGLQRMAAIVSSDEAEIVALADPVKDSVNKAAELAPKLDFANGAVIELACSWHLHAGRDAVIEAAFYGTRGAVAMKNKGGSFLDFSAERF
jgi:predicted dehydrogenase